MHGQAQLTPNFRISVENLRKAKHFRCGSGCGAPFFSLVIGSVTAAFAKHYSFYIVNLEHGCRCGSKQVQKIPLFLQLSLDNVDNLSRGKAPKIITPLDCGRSAHMIVIIAVMAHLFCNQTVKMGYFCGICCAVRKDIHKLPTINVDSSF